MFIQRRPREALTDFQTALDLGGWRGWLSSSTLICAYISALQTADEPRAAALLKKSVGKLEDRWPYVIVQYLRGEVDENAVWKVAENDRQRAEAHGYIGMAKAVKGNTAAAMEHLRWLKEHRDDDGNTEEHMLAATTQPAVEKKRK